MVELMMAVAISGIAALAINSVYSNYIRQKYAIESRSAALADIDTASKFLSTNLPGIIAFTTGPDGTTDLPNNWWNCTQGSSPCVLSAYLSADKSTSNQIMSAQCVTITDSSLGASDIHTFAVDQTKPGDCTQCPQGTMPQLYIQTYSSASDRLIKTSHDIIIPSIANRIQTGTIATGLCFNHDGYLYNKGTSAAPDNVTRFDKWTITLIGVYLKGPIPPNATGAEVTQLLGKVTERIMVAPTQQLGSDIKYLPKR